MTDSSLFSPLRLPNGAVLPNRICKAAMEENLAAPGQVPGKKLFNLYKAWAQGGVGLVLTGNVMVTPSGRVYIIDYDLASYSKDAEAGRLEAFNDSIWQIYYY